MNKINQSVSGILSPGRRKNVLAMSAVILSIVVSSCQKDVTGTGTASLNIFNAMVGSKPLITNFSDGEKMTYYGTVFSLSYGAFVNTSPTYQLGYYSGEQTLWVLPDTASKSTPLLKMTLNLPIGSINSLFLTGTIDNPDTLFTRDTSPYYPSSDSVAGIRFVNLSPGNIPVSINIQGQPTGSEISSLSYKGITVFKPYPATSSVSNYVFEFRNTVTRALITTYTARSVSVAGGIYTPNNWLYRNNTLAFFGQIDSTGTKAPKVIVIRNF